MCSILSTLYSVGWIALHSTTIGNIESDKDSIFFRHQTTPVALCTWCAISFNTGDLLRLIHAPEDMIPSVRSMLGSLIHSEHQFICSAFEIYFSDLHNDIQVGKNLVLPTSSSLKAIHGQPRVPVQSRLVLSFSKCSLYLKSMYSSCTHPSTKISFRGAMDISLSLILGTVADRKDGPLVRTIVTMRMRPDHVWNDKLLFQSGVFIVLYFMHL